MLELGFTDNALLPTVVPFLMAAALKHLEPGVQAAAAAAERDNKVAVQKLFNDMVHVLCVMGGNKLYGCDTSKTGYPLDPQHRIDITLSTQPKPTVGQVARGMPYIMLEGQIIMQYASMIYGQRLLTL